ncbi:MAG: discoidin domain-containing protein, partial [Cytophagaceae bacterium]
EVIGNRITNPRLDGIVVAKGVIGVGNFEENSVSGSNKGGFYNASPGNFVPTFSNNSWQTDMALDRTGWVVTASHNSGALSKAIDGNLTTSWNTLGLQAPGQWFKVDMGSPRAFSQIVMEQAASINDFPRSFQIQTSNDDTNWSTPIYTGEGGAFVTMCSFPQQVARYIRITQTGSAPNSYWSIFEFNVRLSHFEWAKGKFLFVLG